MPTIIYQKSDGECCAVEVPLGTTLMQAAVANGIPGIDAECGGNGVCATCHVYVDPQRLADLPPMRDGEDQMLECTLMPRQPNSRLSCQLPMAEAMDGLQVVLPEAQA